MPTRLTPKQAAFVREYMIDLNATQAAIRAGYKAKTAYQTGAENLRKPQIQKAIQAQREAIEERCRVSMDWVLSQIAEIAQDEEARIADRLKALELLGKHLGLWEKRQDDGAQVVRVVFETGLDDWTV